MQNSRNHGEIPVINPARKKKWTFRPCAFPFAITGQQAAPSAHFIDPPLFLLLLSDSVTLTAQ
jgi:hypothetical protein